MKCRFLFIFLCFSAMSHAQKSVVIFPLESRTDNRLHKWIKYSISEVIFRKSSELQGVQVWDPTFINNLDLAHNYSENDSLLALHQERWGWDLAITGSYTTNNDSVFLNLIIFRHTKSGFARKERNIRCCYDLILSELNNLNIDILRLADINLSEDLMRDIVKSTTSSIDLYASYVTGYGYEIDDDINSAISSYNLAFGLDDAYAPLLYRIGRLYTRFNQEKEAEKFLKKAVSRDSHSSKYSAAMAQFIIQYHDLDKTEYYIRHNRELLESSSSGMAAIGLAYLKNGEYQRAVSVFTRSLAAGCSDLETDFMLGQTYLALGQYQNAINIFGRLIKFRPNHTRYYSFLGETYRVSGKLMESSSILENAMLLDPDNVPNLINLANTYFKLKWYNKAEQFLQRARDLNPELAEIYINLGVIYWHTGKHEMAHKIFSRVADKPLMVQASLNNSANILFLTGNVKKAIKIYKKAYKSGQYNESVLYNLANAYLTIGNKKAATQFFNELLLVTPNRADVLTKLAQLAIGQNNWVEAERFYHRILDNSSNDRNVMFKLIELYELQNKYKEAQKITELYLKDFPQDREYRLKYADIYRAMKWYEVAMAEYERMQQDDDFKDVAALYIGIGACYYDMFHAKKNRQYEMAILNLKKAVEIAPTDPIPDIIIGKIYLEFKKYRELAIEHFDKAFKKSFDTKEREMISALIREAQK